jgi:hypothetical protein
LNQKAAITPDNFPGIDRSKRSGHRKVGVPERAITTELNGLSSICFE